MKGANSKVVEPYEREYADHLKKHYLALTAVADKKNPAKLRYDQFPIGTAIVIFEKPLYRNVCLFAYQEE